MDRVNTQKYADSVNTLVSLARTKTGGGRVAAQVLLSAYNGNDFQLDVTDLCNLDYENFKHAITVICGRYNTRCEPHELVTDGSQVFKGLYKQYRRLHIEERGKQECPECRGLGKIFISQFDQNDLRTRVCTRCGGNGRICTCCE